MRYVPQMGCAAKNGTRMFVTQRSSSRVSKVCDLYCCLLVQQEVLWVCCSGPQIATIQVQAFFQMLNEIIIRFRQVKLPVVAIEEIGEIHLTKMKHSLTSRILVTVFIYLETIICFLYEHFIQAVTVIHIKFLVPENATSFWPKSSCASKKTKRCQLGRKRAQTATFGKYAVQEIYQSHWKV